MNDMKTCTFEGCEKPHRSKGLCAVHYTMKRRNKELMPINKRIKKDPNKLCLIYGCIKASKVKDLCISHYKKTYTCKVPDCTKVRQRKQYCKSHHNQIVLGKIPRKYILKEPRPIKQKETCAVITCMEMARTKGYCSRHYTRVWKHGDPTINYKSKLQRPRYVNLDNPLKCLGGGFNRSEENIIMSEMLREDFYSKDGEESY